MLSAILTRVSADTLVRSPPVIFKSKKEKTSGAAVAQLGKAFGSIV